MLTLRSIERAGPTGEDVRAYPLSYYAATTPTFFSGAALDQDVQADACIIGGGYTGLGAALRLAEAGRSVVLLESGPVGWGASGRNGGQVHLGWNKDQAWLARRLGQDSARALWTMARTARDHLDRLIALDPDRCDFRPGLIHADHKPGYVAQTHEHVAFMRAEYGHDGLTPLGLDDIRALVGSEAYFGGSLDAAGGHLHPLKLALAMARAARDAGAAIHPHSRATVLAQEGAGWRIATPGIGGHLELEANTLAISRSAGQDTQRAFARAQWDLRTITGMGQEVTFTALMRGDVYHSDANALTTVDIYRGVPGWQARGIATAAVDVKWPLVGALFGGSQVLTPRVQLVATPHVRNTSIPNEDSRAADLDDSNLFSLNRFNGYDRYEDGVRVTYGFDWQLTRPGWRISSTVGQSYRLSDEQSLLPPGTGLQDRLSDIVGRTDLRIKDIIQFTHRYRLDKDNFVLRRNEIDATIGDHRTYAEIGYLRLNRNIPATFEDLRDREELRAAARVGFARYFSIFASGVVNLTTKADDPIYGSDGFQMLRHRVGLAYTDDCFDLSVTWKRDYVTTGDATAGNSFLFSVSLRGLGSR